LQISRSPSERTFGRDVHEVGLQSAPATHQSRHDRQTNAQCAIHRKRHAWNKPFVRAVALTLVRLSRPDEVNRVSVLAETANYARDSRRDTVELGQVRF